MKNQFVINGQKYTPVEFGFNTLAELDDLGFKIDEIQKKSIKAIRAYFALCAGIDVAEAGKEIEKHLINGGDLTELQKAMAKEIQESDFFRALQERAEKEDQQSEE